MQIVEQNPVDEYRFSLTRKVGEGDKRCCFIMLNPSTANATEDDPTVRRCIGFAKDLGYGVLEIVNLFAVRMTDSALLKNVREPIGLQNDGHVLLAAMSAARDGGIVICAWGALGGYLGRDAKVCNLLEDNNIPIHVLAMTKGDKQPRHPLYLKKTLKPIRVVRARSSYIPHLGDIS